MDFISGKTAMMTAQSIYGGKNPKKQQNKTKKITKSQTKTKTNKLNH